MSDPVTLAIIGAGNRGGDTYAAHVLRRPKRARVVAVADTDAGRRRRLAERHGVPQAGCFDGWQAVLGRQRLADGVIIATPDRMHVEPAVAAAGLGYAVLLEKPVATDLDALERLDRAVADRRASVTVAHVLRYTEFFRTVGAVVAAGRIGRLISMQHTENIGHFHFAHSFVRGNWRRADTSAPMVLAKACHDMDLLRWLAGAPCTRLSSWGQRTWFRADNAPPGATARCTDGCTVERQCPYSAPRIYLERYAHSDAWPVSVITDDPSPGGRLAALREGPYGRCVYHCDNDVADHQVVALEFEGGVSASLNVCAFTAEITRTLKLMGSEGELRGHLGRGEIEIRRFVDDSSETLRVRAETNGHGGGDEGLMDDFIERLRRLRRGETVPEAVTGLRESLDSHYMALAAEQARREGRVVVPRRAGA